MGCQSFADPEAMSRHQMARELEEALRVRQMTPAEFSEWFKASLEPLQALASIAFEAERGVFRPSARFYKSMAEKQRHDESVAGERALKLALKRAEENAGRD